MSHSVTQSRKALKTGHNFCDRFSKNVTKQAIWAMLTLNEIKLAAVGVAMMLAADMLLTVV